eukprot:tig00020710_g13337.t1
MRRAAAHAMDDALNLKMAMDLTMTEPLAAAAAASAAARGSTSRLANTSHHVTAAAVSSASGGGRRGSNASSSEPSAIPSQGPTHSNSPASPLSSRGRADAYITGLQRPSLGAVSISAKQQCLPAAPGPPGWRLRAKRRARRTAAFFLSIRFLMVIVTVLEVGVAVACSWAITYHFGKQNLEYVARLLVFESHDHMNGVIESYLHQAHGSTELISNAFKMGMMSKQQWRLTLAGLHWSLSRSAIGGPGPAAAAARRPRARRLEHLAASTRSGPSSHVSPTNPLFEHFVRFADGTVYGMHRCISEEEQCTSEFRAIFGNDTALSSYSVDARGQPTTLELAFIGPAPCVICPRSFYHDAVSSPHGASWSGVQVRRVPSKVDLANNNGVPARGVEPEILNRLMVVYSSKIPAAVNVGGSPASRLEGLPAPLDELLFQWDTRTSSNPQQDGTTSTATTSDSDDGPTVVGSTMSVGDLSRILRDALPTDDAVAFVTTESGLMIASSTAAQDGGSRVGDVFDAASGRNVLASENPLALIRAIASQNYVYAAAHGSEEAAAGAGGFGEVLSMEFEGRKYFAGSSQVVHLPNLKWSLYIAVPRETLLSGINGSTTINIIANSIWLVVSVVVAIFLGLRITKPLVSLRRSMVQLAQTMTSMAREFKSETSGADAGPGAGAGTAAAGGLQRAASSFAAPPSSATSPTAARASSAAFPSALPRHGSVHVDLHHGAGSPPNSLLNCSMTSRSLSGNLADAAAADRDRALCCGICWSNPLRLRRASIAMGAVSQSNLLVASSDLEAPAAKPQQQQQQIQQQVQQRRGSGADRDPQLLEKHRVRQSVALGTGLRELQAFEDIIRAMRSGFTAFRDVRSAQRHDKCNFKAS